VNGEVDVDLTARNSAALAVLQSATAAMESELRNSSIDLRNLEVHQEEEEPDVERETQPQLEADGEQQRDTAQDDATDTRETEQQAGREHQVRIVL
jgi:hypothetical protein